MPQIDALRRFLLPALLVLLLAVWLGGGVTQDDTSIDEWLQLCALPLLLASVAMLMARFPDDGYRRYGIAVALVVAAVPLLQLLPMPAFGWNLPPARDALAGDLAQVGVASFPKHWTLTIQSRCV